MDTHQFTRQQLSELFGLGLAAAVAFHGTGCWRDMGGRWWLCTGSSAGRWQCTTLDEWQ